MSGAPVWCMVAYLFHARIYRSCSLIVCRIATWCRAVQRVSKGGRSWRVERASPHRRWAEIGSANVRDARESRTAGAARARQARGRSCYVRGRKGGVKDAMGAATGRRERRAGRYNPFVLRVCQE
jgi:hypothetical protein